MIASIRQTFWFWLPNVLLCLLEAFTLGESACVAETSPANTYHFIATFRARYENMAFRARPGITLKPMIKTGVLLQGCFQMLQIVCTLMLQVALHCLLADQRFDIVIPKAVGTSSSRTLDLGLLVIDGRFG